MENYVFSNLVSPYDARDYKIATVSQEFPEEFELEKVSVKNQMSTGSCVAHACSSVVEYHNHRQEGNDSVFSTEFIYGYRPLGYYVGEGMYIRDALKTLQKVGDCLQSDLRGNNKCPEAMKNVEANLEQLKDYAYPHRISAYAKVNGVNEIKQALMEYGYVVVSMPWYKDYKLTNGVYSTTAKEKSGYHCVLVYGWNKDGWLVHNSWGSFWGKGGRFVVPFEYEWREAWAVIDAIQGEKDIKRPSWFTKNIAPIINKIVNFFRKLFKHE